ncbi:MAG: ornithine cyclodeaminase family protein [Gemmatimonadaceae bacterium]
MEQAVLLSKSEVERLLDVRSCITAVEQAFRQRGEGRLASSGVLALHVDGGGFHAKAAVLELARRYLAVKINANFPDNPSARGLPTIQGVLVLFDATTGVPLAIMDSMAITTLRTAAASAVAARFLARPSARTATFVGCGVQGRTHVAAISAVVDLHRAYVSDQNKLKAAAFVKEMQSLYPFEILLAEDIRAATSASDIIVTMTSAERAFIGIDDVSPGAFIAAVGADNEHKQEIDEALFAQSAVIVDDLEQCAAIGDLHHAINAGVVTKIHVRATLDEVVAGRKPGRMSNDEIIVFDSTGVAIEDVAAASVVYERALGEKSGRRIDLAS